MIATNTPPRTRLAGLVDRARNLVASGLCARISAVPDWTARLDQYEDLAAAPAADRRAALAALDDNTVVDLLVISQLRHNTPFALWADTPTGYMEDILGARPRAAYNGARHPSPAVTTRSEAKGLATYRGSGTR
ncbi:hypothetical protein HHL19_35715 [Streptomyces sp. R302]|uniref:hypothetical protein n=1 Tax=unclassified Streptomyces TaxID=2593676 RepID=UPI00145ECA22|nr:MULTISPECIES: hypothetical protein [unclassified Streptomyces]NML55112.1 hypothetical protein [Streptomyces sp. R301]NML83858.1 hypothetical protein [Streptomyces sp. R302]